MKTKFGAVIVAGSGKIGGHVASSNKGGAYMRTKSTPTNPQTSSQGGVRAIFGSLAQAWRSLTQAQRDAWNAAVSDYKRTDIFGDLRTPSGINLYQRLNNVLLQIGEAALTTPPLPSEVPNVYATNLTYTVGAPSLSLAISETVPADTAVMIFATAPKSAGVNFVKSDFRLIAIADAADTSPVNILSAYKAKFGNVGSVGQKIFVKTVPVNSTTGQQGAPTQVSAISAA